MKNRTLIQFFEWYLPADCSLWRDACAKSQQLADIGITDIWLPPAYKCASGVNDVGYGVYDMYDLGEFDQKGTVATKYGTKDEYLDAIKSLQSAGIKVYADIVFNHRLGADATELVTAKVFDLTKRHVQQGEREISAWTKFTFDRRGKKYSDFCWNHTHFDGTDWDELTSQKALFLFNGKNWDDDVDIEMGNFDYLMGADLDLNNDETYNELVQWGRWYLDTTGIDGFRIDAVKHIKFTKVAQWLRAMREHTGKELFAVGEYWNQTLSALTYYLDKTAHSLHIFDVPLHYNLHKASNSNGSYDMSKILNDTLVSQRPERSVTLVDNHDTQPGQALQSWVKGWFKLHAYSLILLRRDGIPCVFYGDLYGIPHHNINPVGDGLTTLIKLRRDLAYGDQIDYFNDSSVVGFTRLGHDDHTYSGLAVVMTDSIAGNIRMCMGERFIGKTLVNCLGNSNDKVIIEDDGCATFHVNDGSIAVYVDENYLEI